MFSVLQPIFLLWGCITSKSDSALDSASYSETVEWRAVLEDDSRGVMMSIWEAAPNDVWVVGGQAEKGLLIRCQSDDCSPGQWVEYPLPPETPLLNWIHGTGSDDIWLGGLGGVLLHWDGEGFRDFSLDIDEAIWGIYAHSSDSVVVVGGASRWGGEKAFYYRKLDDSFVKMTLPIEFESLTNFFKVSHDGSRFWAVGAEGAMMSCTETCVPIPTGFANDIITITANEDMLHAVGGRGTGIYFQVQDSSLGDVLQIPAGINGISVQGEDILLVGERGYAGILSDTGESPTEIPSITLDVLHAALIDSQGNTYAVGGNLFTAEPSFHGVLLRIEKEQ
jgi:hypothetical protein